MVGVPTAKTSQSLVAQGDESSAVVNASVSNRSFK